MLTRTKIGISGLVAAVVLEVTAVTQYQSAKSYEVAANRMRAEYSIKTDRLQKEKELFAYLNGINDQWLNKEAVARMEEARSNIMQIQSDNNYTSKMSSAQELEDISEQIGSFASGSCISGAIIGMISLLGLLPKRYREVVKEYFSG